MVKYQNTLCNNNLIQVLQNAFQDTKDINLSCRPIKGGSKTAIDTISFNRWTDSPC